jgi:hypothetical protein
MERTGDGYRLSTGKEFYANLGLLSVHPADPMVCSEGYDGGVAESQVREEWEDDAESAEKFTPAERREIAEFMIALWQRFGGIA